MPLFREDNGDALIKVEGLGADDIGAIPLIQKGAPGGVATLGEDGVVLAGQLPPAPAPPKYSASDVGAIALTEKGSPKGVATLGEDGLVPGEQLPRPPAPPKYSASDVGAIALTEKGSPKGVATLGADGVVPAGQLPAVPSQIFATSHLHYWGINSRSLQNKDFLLFNNQQWRLNHVAHINPAAKGDIVEFKCLLQKGRYKVLVFSDQFTNRGIGIFSVNGKEFGRADFYSGAYVPIFKSEFICECLQSGLQTFSAMADKSPTATDFVLAISVIAISEF